MNKTFFIGRTTRDAELRYTQGENPIAVANVSLAVDDGYGDNKTTSFFDLVLWGKRAESFTKHVPKGRKVAVECKAKQNRWTGKEGKNRSSIVFNVSEWEFAEGKGDADNATKADSGDEFMDVDGDLPFM